MRKDTRKGNRHRTDYKCSWPDCSYMSTKGNVMNHYKSVHLKYRPKEYECLWCRKPFTRRGRENHAKVRHDITENWAESFVKLKC